MTPPLADAMPGELYLQAGLENKKAASCSGSRMGNRAAGCHFRPYSFASSPFDDFANMKNSTRKIACQPLSAPPLGGPPTTANPDLREGGMGRRRSLPSTRFDRLRTPSEGEIQVAYLRNSTERALHPRPEAPPSSRIPLPHQNYPPRRSSAARNRTLSSFASLLQPARHSHTSQESWGSNPIPRRITVLTLH